MKLSILVCWGPGREAFWPWLCWNISKQQGLDWNYVEVIVDAPPSASYYMLSQNFLPEGCRLLRMVSPEDELVPVKRNRLMDAASGEYLCWMDSDDWQSPTRLERGLRALERWEISFATFSGLRYLDTKSMRWCELRHYNRAALPITTMGRTEALRPIRFTEDRPRGTDTIWHRMLEERLSGQGMRLRPPELPFFALHHGGNMSEKIIGRFRYDHPLSELRELCGDEWGETDAQLARLLERLE